MVGTGTFGGKEKAIVLRSPGVIRSSRIIRIAENGLRDTIRTTISIGGNGNRDDAVAELCVAHYQAIDWCR